MSIVGIGTDIVAVERLHKLLDQHGDRFLQRCFQTAEREQLQDRQGRARAQSVAGRWAAKEAFLKALGGAIAHIPYHDITVSSSVSGQPQLAVYGAAAKALAERGGRRLHLSISHEGEYAVATVLIED